MAAELAQQGRMDEAETSYANAVLLSPELDMARYQLGLIQFTSGRPSLALVTWQPLFSLRPDATLRLVVQGFAALAQDKLQQAAEQFRQAMAGNTENLPLNGDLQLLLDRIESASATAPVPANDTTSSESSADMDGEHVFLNNYRQSGPAH
jgi:tetratricopeptide (TPR) repeat protein